MVGQEMLAKEEMELTAYCGLYCGDCLRYHSKASDLAAALLSEFQAGYYERYAEVKSKSKDSVTELAHFKECCQVLAAVVALNCEQPCRVGGGCTQFSCSIVECCQEKGYQGCWECGDNENCEKFTSMKPFHGESCFQNLQEIKKHGLEKWAKHRHKFYVWQK
jgi:hypothetical protein